MLERTSRNHQGRAFHAAHHCPHSALTREAQRPCAADTGVIPGRPRRDANKLKGAKKPVELITALQNASESKLVKPSRRKNLLNALRPIRKKKNCEREERVYLKDIPSLLPRSFPLYSAAFFLLAVAVRSCTNLEREFKYLKCAHPQRNCFARRAVNSTQHSELHRWLVPSSGAFSKWRQLCGGIATVTPGTSTVHSFFSVINWIKYFSQVWKLLSEASYSPALSDFLLIHSLC
jgi:hypothetical protein